MASFKSGSGRRLLVARNNTSLICLHGSRLHSAKKSGMRFCQTLNGWPSVNRQRRTALDLRYRKLSLETNELLSSQMTSHRLSSCYGLIVALLLQGLIHRYGPALFRLAVQH